MKKLKYIYLIFPLFVVLFFSRSSFGATHNSNTLKKQAFEIKNSSALLSDFEDVDEDQNKIRFSQREFLPLLIIKKDTLIYSVFFSATSSAVLVLSPTKKRAFISVFRL